jgi:hypothetical protein
VTDQRPFSPDLALERSTLRCRRVLRHSPFGPSRNCSRFGGNAEPTNSSARHLPALRRPVVLFHRHRRQTRTRVGISRRTFSLTRPIQKVSTARRLIPSPRLKWPERLSGRALSTTASSGPVTATSRETLHSIYLITPPVARAPTSRPNCGRGPRPQLQGCPLWKSTCARSL